MRLPIRLRLTIVTGVLMALVLALGGLIIHQRFASDLRSALDVGLRSRAQTLLAGIDASGVSFGDGGELVDPDQAFAQILDAQGRVLESSAEIAGDPLLPASTIGTLATEPGFFNRTVVSGGEPVHARLLAARSAEGPVVIVGASLEVQEESLARLGTLLGTAIPFTVAITTAIGWWLAGAALRPMDRMRVEAAAISVSELDRRLSVPATGDEVARLGETLNGLLARLEESVQRERRFVDDASHELRTPLANLRMELELALKAPRTTQELEAAIRSASAESDRLINLAEDLLVLARAEHGRLPLRMRDVDLATLSDEVIASFANRAADGGVDVLRQGTSVTVRADELRLRQVLANLMDNALRHTPAGGTIRVDSRNSEGVVHLSVSDTGEGFEPGFEERAFEAFATPSSARGGSGGGTGLGLAIVRAIVEAHGGEVHASNGAGGGAIVEISLPADRV